ncbi:hypothetical protein CEXT_18101 [Caerostris extrusa]|uniref:Uncharacterized protein n=1 Tax=Caerostris extrusa TaxID=172846 RepID=A0AAV4XB12_CAEEX|nr:hypothetical protein CEXT_18101 [Caerostris extrusa]
MLAAPVTTGPGGLLPLCKGESRQSDSTPDEARMTSIPVAPGGRIRILSTGNRRTGIIPEYPRTCVLQIPRDIISRAYTRARELFNLYRN